MKRNHSVLGWRHVVAEKDNKVNRQQTQYWEHWEHWELEALTGSCERRTPESSSCCRDTADSGRGTGSGPRSRRPRFHTPHTSAAAPGPSRGSWRTSRNCHLSVSADPHVPRPRPAVSPAGLASAAQRPFGRRQRRFGPTGSPTGAGLDQGHLRLRLDADWLNERGGALEL